MPVNWGEETEELWDESRPDKQYPPVTESPLASILDAPDILTFLKPDQSRKSKDYEVKAKSVLKSCAVTCLRANNPVDGAAILHHGPKLARAAGDLAAESERTAKVIDLLTTPENPWFAFTAIAVTFSLQMLRNHEAQATEASKTFRQQRRARKHAKREGLTTAPTGPAAVIKLPFGRKLTIRMPWPKISFGIVFRAQTRDPVSLASEVLSDEKIIKALAKEGIVITLNE